MGEKDKCPLCRAGRTHDYPSYQGYACGTIIRKDGALTIGRECYVRQLAQARAVLRQVHMALNDVLVFVDEDFRQKGYRALAVSKGFDGSAPLTAGFADKVFAMMEQTEPAERPAGEQP